MKLNQKLIQQLRNGKIAAENEGTVGQLREVVKAAFPEYDYPDGDFRFYFKDVRFPHEWDCSEKTNLPIISLSDFYQPELFTGWAKDDTYPGWMFYFKNDVPKYGFNSLGVWEGGDNCKDNYSEDETATPATHEETERHLTEEANKRGYKGGDTIKGIHGTIHPSPEIISFTYDPEHDRLLTDKDCIVYEAGQWAEIVEQTTQVKTKSNPIHYTVDGIEYSFNYQELKFRYEDICQYSDEQFLEELPEIAHLACIISYFKGLSNNATIGDKGIIHEIIHLMTDRYEPTNDLQEIRKSFNKKIKLS